jgi:hypothetical protein
MRCNAATPIWRFTNSGVALPIIGNGRAAVLPEGGMAARIATARHRTRPGDMEGKLDLARVHKKLEEAEFFLSLMCGEERREIGNRERFDFFLSAFLSAARTVDYRLCHEQAAIYGDWRAAWNASLAPEENSLVKFMVDDRNVEVHESGSSRSVAQEDITLAVGMKYWDDDMGMVTIGGPPDMPPVLIRKQTYNFTIDGAERKATEACTDYLALLQRMVARFEADYP